MNNVGYSPRLPLTDSETHYDMIFDILENIKQNFKNLILTSPGERIMIPNFGVGIRSYLFEFDKEGAKADIISDIESQLDAWMPFVELEEVIFADEVNNVTMDENTLALVIRYSVPTFNVDQEIIINM